MTTSDKIRAVISMIAAIGLCGVCGAVYNNEALPMWARILVDVLSVTNLICTVVTCQGLVKKGKK